MDRLTRLVVVLVLAVFAVGACSSNPPSQSPSGSPASQAPASTGVFHPTFATGACPDDVSSQVVVLVTCGFLTVLEDRSKPGGRTIQVFVARLDPPGGTTTPDPILTIGHLGVQDGYGDMSGSGQRTHRVAFLVDPRGIGHSTPALDCPEVSVIGPDLAGLRLNDPARQAKLLGAVSACHDRLVAQGIDLAAYGINAEAADYEDLRITLGIPSWNVLTFGSQVAFELSRLNPTGIRSMVIDSPTLPMPDFLTVGPASLDLAISRLVASCAADSACAHAYPDVAAMIRNAISKLDAAPAAFDVSGTVDAIQLGHPIHVVIDGAALLRVVRAGLGSSGGANIGQALTTVRNVLDGKLASTDLAVVELSADVGDCLGLLANCEGPTMGVLYSAICGDIAPTIDQSRLTIGVDGRAAYSEAFAPSPLLAACAAWGVGPVAQVQATSLAAGVPSLVMRGAFDPYSASLADVGTAVSGAANVFTVDVPNQSFNVLGYTECPRAIRNAWVDNPTAPPADTSCLATIKAQQLAP